MAMDQEFDWDDDDDHVGNVVHIWEHGVTPPEAEESVLDPRVTQIGVRSVRGERRFTVLGATAAGRILIVVFVMWHRAIRVVTAYDAGEREKRRYRRS